jgi:predicted outer membrane repeat protein
MRKRRRIVRCADRLKQSGAWSLRQAASRRPFTRPLRFEPLEDRRLLAGVVVGNNLDLVNGDTNTIALLIADDGGDGISLREAILAANATAGADEITFTPALSGQTISLLGGLELVITEALTIDAAPLAQNVTITGNNASRILNITAPTGDFILRGLNLTGGRTTGSNMDGGAVRSITTGSLSIEECNFTGNGTTAFGHGGAISANGFVKITESTLSDNSATGRGGAIYTPGNMFVADCTISGNSADSAGGGVNVYGDITLIQSTIVGNSTDSVGGGIYAVGDVTLIQCAVSNNTAGATGGGIRSSSATIEQSTVSGNRAGGVGGGLRAEGLLVTVTDSTFSGNSTSGNGHGGGGIQCDWDLMLIRSTVSGNETTGSNSPGGGIFANNVVTINQSTITNNRTLHATSQGGGVFQPDKSSNYAFSINSSIVSANTAAGGGPDIVRDPQSIVTVNYSVIGTVVVVTAGTGNIATNNPQLGPLANNGGPSPTHATAAASPAINLGDPSVLPDPGFYDQRGGPFVRVFGGRMDAGAYERQTVSGLSLVVDSTDDLYDYDFSAGRLSLREAVALANAMSGPNTITFAPALSGATIALRGTEIEIAESLTIDARPLASNVTIDAQQFSRIFTIAATAVDVTLGGLTITAGKTTMDGAPGQGGAVRSLTTGSLTIDQSTISGSRTTGYSASGGGIFSQGPVTITQSTISGNSATKAFSKGGGIASYNNLTLIESTVSGNSALGPLSDGGGIATTFGGDVTLTQSTVTGNTVSGYLCRGGGIFTSGDVTLTQSTVTENSATGTKAYGSGIYQHREFTSAATITGSILSGNGFSDFAVQSTVSDFVDANYSLIGTGVNPIGGVGNNVVSNNPMLGPLANNGGPTQTRAPLPGSPALDAGDPSIVFNPAEFDQRGAPFVRVVDGDPFVGARIDIGAVERQPFPLAVFGDYNLDNKVDAADYIVWRKTLGTMGVPAYSGADGNGNGTIDEGDYGVWRAHFGQTVPPPGAASGSGASGEGGVGSAVVAAAGQALPDSAATEVAGPGDAPATATALSHVHSQAATSPVVAPAGLAEAGYTAAKSGPALRHRPGNTSIDRLLADTRDEALVGWLSSLSARDEQGPFDMDVSRSVDDRESVNDKDLALAGAFDAAF